MKVVTLSEQSESLRALFTLAQTSDVLIELADGSRFYLAHVTDEQTFFIGDDDDFAEEVSATRQNQALMTFLDERGAAGQQQTGTSIEQVRAQLGV